MTNFTHANDKLKASRCDSINDSNQFDNKMHYFKKLMQLLESAYTGFYLANDYSKAPVKDHLLVEGQHQKNFYLQLFDETLSALDVLLNDMKASNDTNMEGE